MNIIGLSSSKACFWKFFFFNIYKSSVSPDFAKQIMPILSSLCDLSIGRSVGIYVHIYEDIHGLCTDPNIKNWFQKYLSCCIHVFVEAVTWLGCCRNVLTKPFLSKGRLFRLSADMPQYIVTDLLRQRLCGHGNCATVEEDGAFRAVRVASRPLLWSTEVNTSLVAKRQL
jgi:hypothetical protein